MNNNNNTSSKDTCNTSVCIEEELQSMELEASNSVMVQYNQQGSKELILKNGGGNNNNSLLDMLTYDALLTILSFLNEKDLCTFELVSKECMTLATSDYVWRGFYRQYKKRFQNTFNIKVPYVLPKTNAKKFYVEECKKLNMCKRFVGTWTEEWMDVNVADSTKITYDGNRLQVHYTKNKFTAEFVSFDGKCLVFNLSGGDSGWSFYYSLSLRSSPDDTKLDLKVRRVHDNATFTGVFIQRVSEEPSGHILKSQHRHTGITNITTIPHLSGNFEIQSMRRKRPSSLVF